MSQPKTTIIRTPAERFENLPDYPFAPHYQSVAPGIEMHYVDEGPRDGRVVLLLHGQPSWSYLYRKMIPPLVAAGYRVIAPDLVGFGKSDKPTAKDAFTYSGQVAWMRAFIEGLDLKDINVFVQDWGGLIGLRVVAEIPQRFASIIAGNTGLPAAPFPMSAIGRWLTRFQAWRKGDSITSMDKINGFPDWIAHARYAREFNPGATLQSATISTLSDDEIAAYQAPFPDEPYMAGPRAMPWLVPSELGQGHAAWKKLEKLDTPVLLVFSDSDPVTAGQDKVFAKRFKGAKGQPHKTIQNAGHFLQDDKGEEIAAHMIEWLRTL
ncbi:haloalkane dehalogenase [Pyruvatibacter sp.]|uniref:haloalkane dehalogenase n=1 Tax=Pyruvatibacter sp. TaxID=1981328 RepID=UPI0032ECB222